MLASSGATSYIVTREEMRAAISKRRNRPMFLIDIAVPRNIEPSVNELDNVFLYDIDDLGKVVDTNLRGRLEVAQQAEVIIGEEVTRMMTRLRAREASPAIVSLQEQVEQWRVGEIERRRGQAGRSDAAAGRSIRCDHARHHQQVPAWMITEVGRDRSDRPGGRRLRSGRSETAPAGDSE